MPTIDLYVWAVRLGVVALLAACMFVAGYSTTAIQVMWPLTPEQGRDWIAALSGWVAAVGALLAAGMTLPLLRQQAAEAREQTRFLVGDAPPALDIMERDNSGGDDAGTELRIVNWNRRALSLRLVQFKPKLEKGERFAPQVWDIRRGTGEKIEEVRYRETSRSIEFTTPVVIEGWRDRSVAPPSLVVKVQFAVSAERHVRRSLGVEIPYFMPDADPRKTTLSKRTDAEFISDPQVIGD